MTQDDASVTVPGRDQLTKRELPQMKLAEAGSPLTAPIKVSGDLAPLERAQRRFSIEGNVIVTGGAGDIGLASIRALLEHGASGIAIFDMSASLVAAQSSIDTLKSDFPQAKVITMEVDVRDEELVERSVREVVGVLGGVDMLLCCAGIVHCAHAVETKVDDWRRVLDVNTTGSWICAQAVGRQMISQGKGGSIIFVASISAHHVNFPQPQIAYNTSKGALLQLTRSLAGEWARYGIRVNSISPGYMDTILNAGEGLAQARDIWTSRNPMGRMGDPEELTGSIVLLFSRVGGRYINGADIVVDGGGNIL